MLEAIEIATNYYKFDYVSYIKLSHLDGARDNVKEVVYLIWRLILGGTELLAIFRASRYRWATKRKC